VAWRSADICEAIEVFGTGASPSFFMDATQLEFGANPSDFTTTGPQIYSIYSGYIERYPLRYDMNGQRGIRPLTGRRPNGRRCRRAHRCSRNPALPGGWTPEAIAEASPVSWNRTCSRPHRKCRPGPRDAPIARAPVGVSVTNRRKVDQFTASPAAFLIYVRYQVVNETYRPHAAFGDQHQRAHFTIGLRRGSGDVRVTRDGGGRPFSRSSPQLQAGIEFGC
jgi:hypothetical protein